MLCMFGRLFHTVYIHITILYHTWRTKYKDGISNFLSVLINKIYTAFAEQIRHFFLSFLDFQNWVRRRRFVDIRVNQCLFRDLYFLVFTQLILEIQIHCNDCSSIWMAITQVFTFTTKHNLEFIKDCLLLQKKRW